MNLLEQLEAAEKERDALKLQLREAEKKVLNVFANRAVIDLLNEQVQQQRAQISKLMQVNSDLRGDRDPLEKKLDEALEYINGLRNEADDLRKELAEWKGSVAYFVDRAGKLRKERNNYREIIRKVWEITKDYKLDTDSVIHEIKLLLRPLIETNPTENEQNGANSNGTIDSGHFVPEQD